MLLLLNLILSLILFLLLGINNLPLCFYHCTHFWKREVKFVNELIISFGVKTIKRSENSLFNAILKFFFWWALGVRQTSELLFEISKLVHELLCFLCIFLPLGFRHLKPLLVKVACRSIAFLFFPKLLLFNTTFVYMSTLFVLVLLSKYSF